VSNGACSRSTQHSAPIMAHEDLRYHAATDFHAYCGRTKSALPGTKFAGQCTGHERATDAQLEVTLVGDRCYAWMPY
jgi:hypothetical protein